MNRTLQEEFVMYYEDYELEDIYEFNKKMLQLQYFCDITNSRKSEFSQIGMTYTIGKTSQI